MSTAEPFVVCTAASTESFDDVCALAEDVAAVHGDGRLFALWIDADSDVDAPLVIPVGTNELEWARRALDELRLCVEGRDLAASAAPLLVLTLLRRFAQSTVISLAPEIGVFAPLDDLAQIARTCGMALVPRARERVPADGKAPSAQELSLLGAIDPGIVGVGQQGAALCDYWWSLLRRLSCEDDACVSRGQPVLDLLTMLDGVTIVRDAAHGVAYWNLHERTLGRDDLGFTVDGARLRTFHFAGFDARRPFLVSASALPRPRALASENHALGELIGERGGRFGASIGVPPREELRLADGSEVDTRMRRLYRRALAYSIDTGSAPPPNGLDTSEISDFYALLVSPEAHDVAYPVLPRLLAEVHSQRPDLRWHFPRVSTVDAARFREWVERHGLEEESIRGPLSVALQQTPWWAEPKGVVVGDPGHLQPGAVIAGYLTAEAGIGEAARLMTDAIGDAAISLRRLVVQRTPSRLVGNGSTPVLADRLVNVVVVNADQLLGFASVVGPEFFDGRYNVGGWTWETDRMPAEMARSSGFLDELWVPSGYVLQAIQGVVDCPVLVLPYPVRVREVDETFDLGELGIEPDDWYYLFAFDFLSSFERKNPIGVIRAFAEAFALGEGPVLVIKSMNGHLRPADLERLLLAAGDRPDIKVVDRALEPGQQGSLLQHCGCFVSLHRAEGFGLGLAEAMLGGRPVIATGRSGNLDFMDESNSYLVPASTVDVGPNAPPYNASDQWGEPDLAAAAEMMRRVYEAPREASERAALGRRRVAELGPGHARPFILGRIRGAELALERGLRPRGGAIVRSML